MTSVRTPGIHIPRIWRRTLLDRWGNTPLQGSWLQPSMPSAARSLLAEALVLAGSDLAGSLPGEDARPDPALAECLELLLRRPGDWKEDPGAIGELYSLLRRSAGAGDSCPPGLHYTPASVCRFLVNRLTDRPGLHWLDPACGCGAFLQQVAVLDPGAGRIAGGDLDPHALQIARLLGARHAIPGPWELHHTNSLAEPEDLPTAWLRAFDRVVMNPPYRNGVEQGGESSTDRQILKERFSCARGPFDLYIPFVQRALDLLRPGGRLGLVLPDKWLATGYGRHLRRLLAGRCTIEELHHAPRSILFESADVEALLLVLRLEPGGPPARVGHLDHTLCPGPPHLVPQGEFAALADEGWGPLLHATRALWAGADARPRLAESAEVRASMTTGEFYSVTVEEHSGTGMPAIALVSSGAIAPWRHTWGEVPQRFRGASWLKPALVLDGLSASRLAQIGRPRVLLANLSRRLEALPVWQEGLIGVVNVIQIFCRDRDHCLVLAAWLNSAPLNDWLGLWYDPLRLSGQLSLNRRLVGRLPAPPAAGACRERLLELGEAFVALHEVSPRSTRPSGKERELQLELDRCVRAELELAAGSPLLVPDRRTGPAWA